MGLILSPSDIVWLAEEKPADDIVLRATAVAEERIKGAGPEPLLHSAKA
jgi:hypothetical protein